LPEWAEDRHIYILAGMERIATKKANENVLWIKTKRCNHCGKCCMNISHPEKFFMPVVDGNCANLIIYEDGKTDCKLNVDMPLSCCLADPVISNWKDKDICCIEYKKELTQ